MTASQGARRRRVNCPHRLSAYRLNNHHTLAMAQNYQSEITRFLQQYKTQHPDVQTRQREGRARLWDRQIDPELQEAFRVARVPQKPYVYQTN